MKFKSLFCALLAGLTLSACSNDEGVTDKVDKTTDQAYVTISLRNAGALTKGTNGDLQYGEATENAVSTAEFYFFNADGSYNQVVSSSLNWTTNTANPVENVEKIADATVVLKNLKQVGMPRYLVCVLNGTAGAYKNKTLAEMKEMLLESYLNNDKFIITNSTYNNGDAKSLNFATVIKDENFQKEKPQENYTPVVNPVQVYVERVASKIGVGVASNLLTNGKISLGNYDIDGVQTEITIEVQGWGINALNKTSYVGKHVPAWGTNLGFDWDAASSFRSFWACSPNYGGGEYPLSFANVVDNNNSTDKVTVNTDAVYSLKYVSWNSLQQSLGAVDYCLENTNTEANLIAGNNFKAKVTHVLLKAQIATSPLIDLVRYEGRLFSPAKFKEFVLAQKNFQAYKVTTTGESTKYTQIGVDDIEIVNTYDGTVTVGLTQAAKDATWSSSSTSTIELTSTALAEQIATEKIKADYYKEGMMYYCIPVEHLRGGKLKVNNDGIEVKEADYGVVRNHYYMLTINSITKLGTAVYNPDEEIIPNMDPETYYVGAQVNILSWKVVNQSVDL